MSGSEIVRKELSEIEFKRWQKIMDKIEFIKKEKAMIQDVQISLTKLENAVFEEMQKFWERRKAKSR